MATPQTWHWAAHILSKGKNKLICDRCKDIVELPIEPSKDIDELTTEKEKKNYRTMWLWRIRAIGDFVIKHRYCQ